jgi:hypothetical protein
LLPDKTVGKINITRDIQTLSDETQEKIYTHILHGVPDHKMVMTEDYHNLVKQLDKHSFKMYYQNFFRLVSDTVHQGPLMPQGPKHLGTAWKTFIKWEDRCCTPKHIRGVQKDMPQNNPPISQDWESKHQLDRNTQKHKWVNSGQPETKELIQYEFAPDRGKLKASDPTLEGYKKIYCQMTFDTKQGVQHKSQGYNPLSRSHDSLPPSKLHIVILITKLNDLELNQLDIEHAYPEPKRGEQNYSIHGKHFPQSKMEDHMLTFYKAQLVHLKTFIDQWKATPKDHEQEYQTRNNGTHILHLGCMYIQEQEEKPQGFLNRVPIDCHYKKQSTVAQATLGSKFVAARKATKKDYDPRYILRMIQIHPHPQLEEQYDALAHDNTHKTCATYIKKMVTVAGTSNPVDDTEEIFDKHEWMRILRPVKYWQGKYGDRSN